MTEPLKILIVDDDPDGAAGLADLMTVFGHESRIAHSGADAVAAFSDEQFDLTFMDVHMPGMNGVEACSKIRQSDPHAKLVFITGLGDDDLHRQAHQCGVMGVLRKPICIQDILGAIEEIGS